MTPHEGPGTSVPDDGPGPSPRTRSHHRGLGPGPGCAGPAPAARGPRRPLVEIGRIPHRDRSSSVPRSVQFRAEIGSLPARDRGPPAGRAAGRWNCHDPGQRDPALLRAVGLHGEDVVGAGVSPARSPAEHEGARETDPRDRMSVRMTLETRGAARVGEILAITRFSARVSGIRAVNVILADIDAARTRTKTEARRVTAGSLRTSASGTAAPGASGTSMSVSTPLDAYAEAARRRRRRRPSSAGRTCAPDRSRCGTRPISVRNSTDLDEGRTGPQATRRTPAAPRDRSHRRGLASGEGVRYIALSSHRLGSSPLTRGTWRIRLVAYGARLESVLGASPRGFESPILRCEAPESLRFWGFSLL